MLNFVLDTYEQATRPYKNESNLVRSSDQQWGKTAGDNLKRKQLTNW